MTNNLKLWNSVCTTDIKYTKKTKLNGMQITAIDPQYQKQSATEAFGPFGVGWGVDSENIEYLDIGDTKLANYSAILWYFLGADKGKIPIRSNIKVSYKTSGENGYLKIDDNYAKKLQTDALTKGLSNLGFNADIFLGKFEDNRYLSDRTLEAQADDIVSGEIAEQYLSFIENKESVQAWLFECNLKRLTGFNESNMSLFLKCVTILQGVFPDGKKTAYKATHADLVKEGAAIVSADLTAALSSDDEAGINENWNDLEKDEKRIIWAGLCPQAQKLLNDYKANQ